MLLRVFFGCLLLLFCSCDALSQKEEVRPVPLKAPKGKAIAAFASGCFWCTEHIFDAIPGVDSVISGYAGGHTKNPTYDRVNTETTGHAETVLVYYDPQKLTFAELATVFFASHDPTTPNRQGPDVGSSYRSILFYQTDQELQAARQAVRTAAADPRWKKPIVTELKKLSAFYRAEGYHQDFIRRNPNHPYVQSVSMPRYEDFKKHYKGKLKPGH